ncbi:MAG TPA: hypothetical protein VEV19_10790 [Ktedonobacteraceae bacterium]|nr:hypothetical protein [Ktedonobacteraceae bacterium]
MRIDNLPYRNLQTQGTLRREWLRRYSPQHLEQCSALILHALKERPRSTSRSIVVLGAGASTEIPLADLARAADEVVLVDLDRVAMQQGRDELPSRDLRKRVTLLTGDISGGVSERLRLLLKRQPWDKCVAQGGSAVFDAAAACLEQCPVPDPPELEGVGNEECGLVISSLVLTQLYSYPLLDILDHVQSIAPQLLEEQERHRRYQDATQAFRLRMIEAHLHLLRSLVDRGGHIVLLTDMRGFVFEVYGTDHDAEHRRVIPLVPRTLPELIRENFTVKEEHRWEWLTDLPENGRLGRGYEVAGYVLT